MAELLGVDNAAYFQMSDSKETLVVQFGYATGFSVPFLKDSRLIATGVPFSAFCLNVEELADSIASATKMILSFWSAMQPDSLHLSDFRHQGNAHTDWLVRVRMRVFVFLHAIITLSDVKSPAIHQKKLIFADKIRT